MQLYMQPCSSGSSCPHPPFVQFQGGLLFQSEGYKKGRLILGEYLTIHISGSWICGLDA